MGPELARDFRTSPRWLTIEGGPIPFFGLQSASPVAPASPEHAYPRPPTTVTSIAGRLGQGRTGCGQGSATTLSPVHSSPRATRTGRTPHHQTIDEIPPYPAEQATKRGDQTPCPGVSGLSALGGWWGRSPALSPVGGGPHSLDRCTYRGDLRQLYAMPRISGNRCIVGTSIKASIAESLSEYHCCIKWIRSMVASG